MNVILKRISSVGMGNVLGQGIALLSLPLIARLFSPEAFGLWILFQSVVLIFSTVATLRFELAILLPKAVTEAVSLLVLGLSFSLISAFLAWFIIEQLGELLFAASYARISSVAYLAVIFVFSGGVYYSSLSWLTRTKKFQWYSFGCFGLPFFTAAFQLGFGYWGQGDFTGLVIGSVIGQSIAAAVLIVVVVRDVMGTGIKFAELDLYGSFVNYRNYPIYMTPFTLLGTLRNRVIYLLLNSYSTVHAGFYGMAFRLTNTPNGFFTGAVRPVFFQWAVEKDFRKVEQTILTILRIMIALVVPSWLVMLIYIDGIVGLVFGDEWLDVGQYIIILSFPAVALLLTNWLDRGFDVLGAQKTAFRLELFFSIAVILTLVIGSQFIDDIFHIVMLQAAVMFTYFWIWLHFLFAKAGFSARSVVRIFGYFVVMVGVLLPTFYLSAAYLPEIAALFCILLLAGGTTAWHARKNVVELKKLVLASDGAS